MLMSMNIAFMHHAYHKEYIVPINALALINILGLLTERVAVGRVGHDRRCDCARSAGRGSIPGWTTNMQILMKRTTLHWQAGSHKSSCEQRAMKNEIIEVFTISSVSGCIGGVFS